MILNPKLEGRNVETLPPGYDVYRLIAKLAAALPVSHPLSSAPTVCMQLSSTTPGAQRVVLGTEQLEELGKGDNPLVIGEPRTYTLVYCEGQEPVEE